MVLVSPRVVRDGSHSDSDSDRHDVSSASMDNLEQSRSSISASQSRLLRLQLPGLEWKMSFDSYKEVTITPKANVPDSETKRKTDFVYSGLCLSHPDVGSVTWLEPVSLLDEDTGHSVDLKQVVKMGIDPVSLRPFIALFWNPDKVPPPEGKGLNKRVRVVLKSQFL